MGSFISALAMVTAGLTFGAPGFLITVLAIGAIVVFRKGGKLSEGEATDSQSSASVENASKPEACEITQPTAPTTVSPQLIDSLTESWNNFHASVSNTNGEKTSEVTQHLSCTKCQSDNIQKIEMAYQSGRFKGTPLESQIKPPVKIDWMPDWLYFSSMALAILVVWKYFNFFGWKPWTIETLRWYVREASMWETLKLFASLLLVGIGGAGVCALMFQRPLNKRATENQAEYQAASDRWKYEFICHKCGHRFLVRPNP